MTNPTNVKDEEIAARSVMMRVYRSRISGEAFYPGQFVNGEAPGLEAKGWIERRGDGWRMTDNGVKAWAEMSLPVMNTKWRSASQNELMHAVGRPIIRLKLEQTSRAMLRALVENGGELPFEIVVGMGVTRKDSPDIIGLQTLMSAVYVISDEETVRLTDIGWMVAMEMNFTKGLKAMEEKAVLTNAQLVELQDIDEESNHGDGWCDVSEVNKEVLKELEKANYIATNEQRTSGRITGMGRKALENYVIRETPEHGRMLLEMNAHTEANKKPYENIMRKTNGDVPQRPVVEQIVTKPPKRTCIVDGCDEPRMIRKDGAEMTRCQTHQREYWNEQSAKQRTKKDKKALATAAKEIEAEDAAKNAPSPPTPLPQGARGEKAACDDCGDCVQREVLDMLRAKFPEVDELVELMTRAKEIRNRMGI